MTNIGDIIYTHQPVATTHRDIHGKVLTLADTHRDIHGGKALTLIDTHRYTKYFLLRWTSEKNV